MENKDLPESKPEPSTEKLDTKDPCFECVGAGTRNCSVENCRCHPNNRKPEKNCGNCAHNTKYPNPNCEGTSCKETGYSLWQPKAAEPQGWEQRVCSNCNYKSACAADKIHNTCTTIDAIRAEIERVRKEERNRIVAFIRGHWLFSDGIAPIAGDIEQDKHRTK